MRRDLIYKQTRSRNLKGFRITKANQGVITQANRICKNCVLPDHFARNIQSGKAAKRLNMETLYNRDIISQANEQAAFMRSSQFDKLNLINLAEKIEDSGKSEKRELANRLTLLITYLLKQQFSLQTKA